VNEYDLPLFEKFIGTDLDLCSYQHLNILCGRKQWRRYVRGGRNRKEKVGDERKKTHRILTQKPEMHSEHTSPHIS
jgi:hypothetical protein